MLIKVGGIDPSLRATGLAGGIYDADDNRLAIDSIDLIETESLADKTVRKASDDLRCAQELHAGVQNFIAGSAAVFGEVPSGAQSARAAFALGIAVGVIAGVGILKPSGGRLIQVSAAEVKKMACGSKNASKDEMIAWAMEKWPHLPWLIAKAGRTKGKPIAKNEHMADACGVINAGVQTDQFLGMIEIMRSLTPNSQ